MAITIRGIRLKSLTINMDAKGSEGESKMSCSYQLISSTDKVLAEQEVGGYNGLKVAPSPQTHKALDEFITAYRNDINMVLGLDAQ